MSKFFVSWSLKDRNVNDKGCLILEASSERQAEGMAANQILPNYPLSYWNAFKCEIVELVS